MSKFNPQIFTREDVKIAVQHNPYADNIMRYVDMLLYDNEVIRDWNKTYKEALDIASCEAANRIVLNCAKRNTNAINKAQKETDNAK